MISVNSFRNDREKPANAFNNYITIVVTEMSMRFDLGWSRDLFTPPDPRIYATTILLIYSERFGPTRRPGCMHFYTPTCNDPKPYARQVTSQQT